MIPEIQIWLVVGAVFMAVAVLTSLTGAYAVRRSKTRARLGVSSATTMPQDDRLTMRGPGALIARFDDRLLGLSAADRSKLRSELIRAGIFSADAPKYFTLIKAGLTVALPIIGYFWMYAATSWSSSVILFGFVMLLIVGFFGPDAYLKRRQSKLQEHYRILFPDMLDVLQVCADAGLSLESSFVRVGDELAASSAALAQNIAIMNSGIRTGLSTAEAIAHLADRLGIDDAKSFSLLLKQSIELGSDITETLRAYSTDMREKRLVRAETRANQLPVKMLLPLGLFIFPVLMMVILTPAVLKITGLFKTIAVGR